MGPKKKKRVQLFGTLWTVARQAPLSMGFPRQEYWSEKKKEYWSGLPFPPPGDLSDPGTESASSVVPALASGFFTTEPSGKPLWNYRGILKTSASGSHSNEI